jgi:imidazolonepropionase-like amidohydrolase
MIEPKVLTADYLWDGINDHLIPKGAVLIENNIITMVLPYKDLSPDFNCEIIDFKDATLMPGLIDSHTHLSMDPTLENYLDHMEDNVAELTIRAVNMMEKDLKAGITSCRCLGDKEYLDIACRKAVENKQLPGPRLLVAGKGIRATAGHGFVGYPHDGLRSMQQSVKENISKGVDLIKFYITGTLKGDGQIPSFLSREEIQGLIDEAHKGGLRSAAHCVGGIGLDWALEAGLDSLEHAYHISDTQIEMLAKSTTWPVLTPSPLLMEERIDHLPVELISGHKKEKEEIKSRMNALISSGIPYAIGSDGMHAELSTEIAYLVEMGATNVSALKAATIHGAKVAGIESVTGSLEAGKKADIIAVSGNPLENIKVLKKLKAVMMDGEWIIKPEETMRIKDPDNL